MKWKLDIEELNVDHYYKTGDGYQCLCEFHFDTHPSMFVNTVEQFFHCFSCGETGTISKLIEVTGGKESWVKNDSTPKAKNDEWRKKLQESLAHNDDYIYSRGVTDEQIDRFGILSNSKEIIFPLKDLMGKVIGLKIRLKQSINKVKYLTFGKQPNVYFNFNYNTTQNEQIWVTEGIFGLLALDRIGVNCMTPLSANRVHVLAPIFKTKDNCHFNLFFDADLAGYYAAILGIHMGSGYGNVFSSYAFGDIDDRSREALLEITNESRLPLSRTRSTNAIFHKIRNGFGDEIEKKYRKRFYKHIKDGK